VSIAENLDTAPDGTSLHAANRVGHQGLFFERFAGDYTTQPLSPTDGAGLYFNRNRFYSPTLGRFIQRDPNETALPILTALATNAETLAVAFGPFDAQVLYANGPNLYQYEGSNPVNNRDPSGLDWDPFDEADDVLMQIQAEKAAWGEFAYESGYAFGKAVMMFAAETAITAICPPVGVFFAAYGVADSLNDIIDNGLTMGNAFGLAANAAGLRGSVQAYQKFNHHLNKARAPYLARGRTVAAARSGYRAFTLGNFRHNLEVLTGRMPNNAHAHHVFPQQLEPQFNRLGIKNIHEPRFGAWWNAHAHQVKSYQYAKEWEVFLGTHPNPDAIMQKGRQLADRYEFAVNY